MLKNERGNEKLTHLDGRRPTMVDVGGKDVTRREAEAEGEVLLTEAIVRAVGDGSAKKGDVLRIAELAGIMAAKRTPDLIPLCHPIRLDSVRVFCALDAENRKVTIRALAVAEGVTGVEMEALTAVSAAALTVYDMCKGIDKGMRIENIRLLRKSGGKSGLYESAERGEDIVPVLLHNYGHDHGAGGEKSVIRAAVLTVSDRGSRGEREDTAGPALRGLLEAMEGVEVVERDIVPDERETIAARLRQWAPSADLILTTGGTGLSDRDVTPEALSEVADRVVPGLGELMRAESLKHTPNAPLSRALAVTLGRCLIAALPGSERGARQCFEAIRPSLRHAVDILQGRAGDGP